MDSSVSYKEDKLEAHYARVENLLSAKLEQHQLALERIIVNVVEQTGFHTSAPCMNERGGELDNYVPSNENLEQLDLHTEEVLKCLKEDKIVTIDDKVTYAPLESLELEPQQPTCQLQNCSKEFTEVVSRHMGSMSEFCKSQIFRCCRRRCRLHTIEALEDSTAFDAVAMISIIASSIYIGYQTDYEIKKAAYHNENGLTTDNLAPSSALAVEIGFTLWFTFELIIRILAWQGEFFINDEWVWNCIDVGLVVSSLLDLLFSSLGFDLKYVRLLRLLRMMRGTRTLRVLRFFRTFRILLMEFMGALMPLIWAIVFILILTFIFAVCILQGVTLYLSEVSDPNSSTVGELLRFFDNLPKALFSLYMAGTGGVSWIEMALPLLDISFIYCALLTLYVTVLMLVAFNIITATFVSEVEDIIEDEEEEHAEEQIKEKQNVIAKYTHIFQQLDSNGSGTISRDEFGTFASKDEVKAFFEEVSINAKDAMEVFEMLDENHTGDIELDEFVVGCMNLKGMAKTVTMNALMQENKRILKRLESLECGIKKDIRDILNCVGKQGGKAKVLEPLKASKDLPKSPQDGIEAPIQKSEAVVFSRSATANKIAAPAPVAPVASATPRNRPKQMKKASAIETE